MKETFAGKVRAAIQQLGKKGQPFTVQELALQKLDLLGHQEKRPVYAALRDLEKSGYIVKVSPGVYRLGNAKKKKIELQEIMWRLLRARRKITVDDLEELAGCSADYAREWLESLSKRGVVRRATPHGKAGVWQMIADPVEMPRNEEKAERLRALRDERRKQAVARANAKLDEAYRSILEARIEINSIDDDKPQA